MENRNTVTIAKKGAASKTTDVSVIVPVLNSGMKLAACLSAIRASTYRDYELIVVDDGSADDSGAVGQRCADIVVKHEKNAGEGASRNSGVAASHGSILVFIDADVVIAPDSIERVVAFFRQNASVTALTGRLSLTHPYTNFFSQYKNLYMHYIFGLLPEKINFLYGSIHAVRRKDFIEYDNSFRFATDTEAGLEYAKRGCRIAFLRDLEVVHLKEHTAGTFVRNDFYIPAAWGRIFIENRGFKQLFKNRTGFAHAPKEQICSVVLAPVIALLSPLAAVDRRFLLLIIPCSIAYLLLNGRFFAYILHIKGAAFAVQSAAVTFADNIIMAAGIFCGFLSGLSHWRRHGE